MDLEQASKWLCEQISQKTAFATGKIGTSELNAIFFYLQRNTSKSKPDYPHYIIREMTQNAGFWSRPNTSIHDELDAWSKDTLESIKTMDAVVVWSPTHKTQESALIKTYNPNAKQIVLRALEPYYTPENLYTDKMTKGLIAVICPFADSIQKQWSIRDQLFPFPLWLPNQELVTIKAPYGPYMTQSNSPNCWPEPILNTGYKTAVAYLVSKVIESGAKYALVGIGCLSLLLVCELKKHNIVAIHTGGGTQIIFGLKGNRWSQHSVISKFFNPIWIKPSDDEIPTHASKVESSCYW